jgi:hypothetical protein
MPDIDRISTSHVEKQNHTLRMHSRHKRENIHSCNEIGKAGTAHDPLRFWPISGMGMNEAKLGADWLTVGNFKLGHYLFLGFLDDCMCAARLTQPDTQKDGKDSTHRRHEHSTRHNFDTPFSKHD